MSGEDVMGWDDGTIWKIEEVVVKIAARLLPNQTLPDLHMSVGLWETVLAISLEQTLYKEDGTIWLEALKWNIYYDHMTHAITNLMPCFRHLTTEMTTHLVLLHHPTNILQF